MLSKYYVYYGRLFADGGRGSYHDYHDGAGLCSPGRWPIAYRKLPSGKLSDRLQRLLVECLLACEREYPRPEPYSPNAAANGGVARGSTRAKHSSANKRKALVTGWK